MKLYGAYKEAQFHGRIECAGCSFKSGVCGSMYTNAREKEKDTNTERKKNKETERKTQRWTQNC